jgi:hypothetical protein
MSQQTTIACTAIAQAKNTIALVAIWSLVPLLNDVIWNQFPRERKEVRL